MLEAARTRWPALDFRRATADFLPLPDVSMSGYRADKVFHEIASPTTALAEAQRVLRPGGRIVLLGQDWDAIIIDSDHPEITRTLVHARADTITNPRAARAHRTILLDNGFHDTTVEAHTSLFTTPEILPMLTALAESAVTTTAVSRDDVDTWLTDQTARARSNRLFVTLPIFIAAGTRP
jgi:ubiquinone/menaquinone biosynthesis C-methylase UbiE